MRNKQAQVITVLMKINPEMYLKWLNNSNNIQRKESYVQTETSDTTNTGKNYRTVDKKEKYISTNALTLTAISPSAQQALFATDTASFT